MNRSYWTLKALILGTIAAGMDYVIYQDFSGKELRASMLLLAPYAVALLLPRRFIAPALAIPIAGALTMSIPILLSFLWGLHTDPKQDAKLGLVLVAIVATCVSSLVAVSLNRRAIRAAVFSLALAASLVYYAAMLQYAR